MSDLAAIRDQVIAGANLHALACEAGFEPASGRRGWFHHGRGDRTPSAHIRGDGLFCFHCSRFHSKIDLIMLRDGHADYIKALRTGAEEIGIEWKRLSTKQRAEKRAETELARRIADDAADWIHGLRLVMLNHKSDLIDVAQAAWNQGQDALGDAIAEVAGRIPRAVLSPESADPGSIVRAYRAAAITHPEATRRILACGREDRKDAEQITKEVVYMLAASQTEGRRA